MLRAKGLITCIIRHAYSYQDWEIVDIFKISFWCTARSHLFTRHHDVTNYRCLQTPLVACRRPWARVIIGRHC